jgi:hypothetical protein
MQNQQPSHCEHLCHVHPRIVARSSSKETNATGKNLPPNKK